MAVVLTHNARAALGRCLGALRGQTLSPSEILVTDNASKEAVDDLVAGLPNGRVLRLPENAGPAGGYAAALRTFLRSELEWAWVMDDDCVPHPAALEAQLAIAAQDRVVMSTMIDRDTGENANTQGWCGVLLPRRVVESVGVPDEALFWWTEDTEYLQWRIPRAGFEVARCEDAVVEVARARDLTDKPAWKYYYETRNQVHYRMHIQAGTRERPLPRHLRLRVRSWRAGRSVAKLAGRVLLVERTDRPTKLRMVARGAVDGISGRLGRTVLPDDAHRPVVRGHEDRIS
jgi:GT2 family glycosyltransferase